MIFRSALRTLAGRASRSAAGLLHRRWYSALPHVWECLRHLPVAWTPTTADVLWPDDMRKPVPLPHPLMQAVVLERFQALSQPKLRGRDAGIPISVPLQRLAGAWRDLFLYRAFAILCRRHGIPNQFVFGTPMPNAVLRALLEAEGDNVSHLNQLLENEMHLAWEEGCLACSAALGREFDAGDFLLRGLMDGTDDPLTFFPRRTLEQAAQRMVLPLPDCTASVQCSEVELEALRWVVVERAITRQPLPAILGFTFFCGLLLRCDTTVHVPHKFTENYTAWVLANVLEGAAPGSVHVLDVCCGNGCIALAAASSPSVAQAVGCDVDGRAVELAVANSLAAGASNVHFVQTDGGLRGLRDDPINLIVGNIPRVIEEALSSGGGQWVVGDDGYPQPTSPAVSFGGPDGLAILRIVAEQGPHLLQNASIPHLNPNLAVEYHPQGPAHEQAVLALFSNNGWEEVQVRRVDGAFVLTAHWPLDGKRTPVAAPQPQGAASWLRRLMLRR
eukprot:GGOE01041474.1.p1 GENE.GGOE01041474.1~~GGOE01041474.1.p1  ORF type:complete len:502 (-),score=115.99 GGOE01041474.1:292-1797(-)